MSSIFVSYRHQDSKPASAALFRALTARFGADNVVCDVYSLRYGVDAEQQLASTLGKCSVLLAIIGPAWVSLSKDSALSQGTIADNGINEILFALNRGIPVVPVLVDGARAPEVDELASGLSAATREQLERSFGNLIYALPVDEASLSDAIRDLADKLETYLSTQTPLRAIDGSQDQAATSSKNSSIDPEPSAPKPAASAMPQPPTVANGTQGQQQARNLTTPPALSNPTEITGAVNLSQPGSTSAGTLPDPEVVQQLVDLIAQRQPFPIELADFWRGRLDVSRTVYQSLLPAVADRLAEQRGAQGLERFQERYDAWLKSQSLMELNPDTLASRAVFLQAFCEVATRHSGSGAGALVRSWVNRFVTNIPQWHHELLNRGLWSEKQRLTLLEIYAGRQTGINTSSLNRSLESSPLAEAISLDFPNFPFPPLGAKSTPSLDPWLHLLAVTDQVFSLGHADEIAAWMRLRVLLADLGAHWKSKPSLWQAPFGAPAWNARANELGEEIVQTVSRATRLVRASEDDMLAAWKRLSRLQLVVNRTFEWQVNNPRDRLASRFCSEARRAMRNLTRWDSRRAKVRLPKLLPTPKLHPLPMAIILGLCAVGLLYVWGPSALEIYSAAQLAVQHEREKQESEQQRLAKSAEEEARRLKVEPAEQASRLAGEAAERQRQKEIEERRVAEAEPTANAPQMANPTFQQVNAPEVVISALLQVTSEEIRQLDCEKRLDLKVFQSEFDRLQTFAKTPPPLLRILVSPLGTIRRRQECISAARDVWKIGGQQDLHRIQTLLCKARDPAYCEAIAVMLANKAKTMESTHEGLAVREAWLSDVINKRRVINVTDLTKTDLPARKRLAERLIPRLADEVQKGLLSDLSLLEDANRKRGQIDEFERRSAEHYIRTLLDVEKTRLQRLQLVRAAAIAARKPHFLDLPLPLPTDDKSAEIPVDFHVISATLHGLKELSAIRHASDASPGKTAVEPVYRLQWSPVGLNELKDDNWSVDAGRPLVLKSVSTAGAPSDVLRIFLPAESQGAVKLTIPRNTSPKHGEELQLTVLELFGADPLTGAPRSEWYVLSGDKPVLLPLPTDEKPTVASSPQIRMMKADDWNVSLLRSGLLEVKADTAAFSTPTSSTDPALSAATSMSWSIGKQVGELLKRLGEENVPTADGSITLSLDHGAPALDESMIAFEKEGRGLTRLEGLLTRATKGKVGPGAAEAWAKNFNEIIGQFGVTSVDAVTYYPFVTGPSSQNVAATNESNKVKAIEQLNKASKQIDARKAEVEKVLSEATKTEPTRKYKTEHVGLILDAWRVIADDEIADAQIELPLWSRSKLPVGIFNQGMGRR